MGFRRTARFPGPVSNHVNEVTCIVCEAEIPTAVPDWEGVHAVQCPNPNCRNVQDVRFRPVMDVCGGNWAAVAWMAEPVPRE